MLQTGLYLPYSQSPIQWRRTDLDKPNNPHCITRKSNWYWIFPDLSAILVKHRRPEKWVLKFLPAPNQTLLKLVDNRPVARLRGNLQIAATRKLNERVRDSNAVNFPTATTASLLMQPNWDGPSININWSTADVTLLTKSYCRSSFLWAIASKAGRIETLDEFRYVAQCRDSIASHWLWPTSAATTAVLWEAGQSAGRSTGCPPSHRLSY